MSERFPKIPEISVGINLPWCLKSECVVLQRHFEASWTNNEILSENLN
jgi:hypothetical protein